MSYRSLLLCLAALFSIATPSGRARAQLREGQINGLNLVYSPQGGLLLTRGSAFISDPAHGVDIQASSTLETLFATPPLTGTPAPATLAPNLAYYCFLVNGTQAGNVQGATPNTLSLICSSTIGPSGGPSSDGHPSANLVAPAFPNGGTQYALFVGSFLTDSTPSPNTKVVHFYRNGQEVLLVPAQQAPVAVALDANVHAELAAIDPGAGITQNPFPSGGFNPVEWSYALPTPFPLLSASGVLLDVHLYNADSTIGHVVYALDPTARALPYGAGFQEQIQASLQVDPALQQGVDVHANPLYTARAANARVRLNYSATGAVRFGMDKPPAQNSVRLVTVLRGYVEPIRQLFP